MHNSSLESLYDELQHDLLNWLLLPLALIGFLLAFLDIEHLPPPSPTALGFLMGLDAAILWWLRQKHASIAAWATVLTILFLIVLAWHWLQAPNLRYALILPALAGGMIRGSRGAMVAAGAGSLVLGLSAWWAGAATGQDGFLTSLFILWLATYLVCAMERSRRTVAVWSWEHYSRASNALEQARDRQVELKQALADSALARKETSRLNDMLLASRQALNAARSAKDEFVANVSHEFRTPLNMIIGFSDEILERPEGYGAGVPIELLDDIRAIRRNSDHLARLVDDVLDLAEAETGHLHLLREKTCIQDLAREAIESVAVYFQEKKLSLELDVPEDLPPAYCDRARIRQVILNLLSNAGRFTEVGWVRVRAALQGSEIVISVSDTGRGIDAATKERLFQPFQQADASIRRRYGGTGLGLAISKQLVEAHGGRIWLESQLGQGMTVSFALPEHRGAIADEARRWFSPYQEYSPRTGPSLAPNVTARPAIVIVEAGNTLTRLAEQYLDQLELISVPTIDEARRVVDCGGSVAALINRGGPLQGGGTLEPLTGAAFDVPIISCWVPDPGEQNHALNICDYLVKPILRSQLRASLQKASPKARTVLLVDDDMEARQLFTRMLVGLGIEVLTAVDGEDALYLMRQQRPDVLLLDIVMPRMDGFAVLRAMAADATIGCVPVIIISARDPERNPIVSENLMVTRSQGLSARDLMLGVQAIAHALGPRFAAPARRGTHGPSPSSE